MNMWGWTPAGPSLQGTNRHVDGETQKARDSWGPRERNLLPNVLSSPQINECPESCRPGFWWPVQCQTSRSPDWVAEGYQCREERPGPCCPCDCWYPPHKRASPLPSLLHALSIFITVKESKDCSFQAWAVQRKGKVARSCGLSGGQRKWAHPVVRLQSDIRKFGLHDMMAPVSWEETLAGGAGSGYAFWCLMLGCFLSLTWPEPGYHG